MIRSVQSQQANYRIDQSRNIYTIRGLIRPPYKTRQNDIKKNNLVIMPTMALEQRCAINHKQRTLMIYEALLQKLYTLLINRTKGIKHMFDNQQR